MTIRARFAPSPTGQVHIGNIRVAIFNWLFARHENGEFLLRLEDTDRERSTPEAIATLFEQMDWLGLDYDEEPLYQSTQVGEHEKLAEKLLQENLAYRTSGKESGEAIVFRIPWHVHAYDCVRSTQESVMLQAHPEQPVVVNHTGVNYATVSRKGKPVPQKSCLAGMADLVVYDKEGNDSFVLPEHAEQILEQGETFTIKEPGELRFTRFEVYYDDLIKGTLTKPLDSLKDVVIVRSDGSPVFHLANVCDDLSQGTTHIIRGDDHVENTYRHILLYHALGESPPAYAHLPMIVNAQGKPYSKRDGDAFVGELRAKGYLPDAVFNYLALLGWSPGDDREKMSRRELVEAFTLDRVQHTPAQMDLRKLESINGSYLSELDQTTFTDQVIEFVSQHYADVPALEKDYANRVAGLMQSRTKKLADVASWLHFFQDIPDYDEKECKKLLTQPSVPEALRILLEKLQNTPFTTEALEEAIHETTAETGIKQGKLNQPLRAAVTGQTVGAGIYETLEVIGREKTCRRIEYALKHLCGDNDSE